MIDSNKDGFDDEVASRFKAIYDGKKEFVGEVKRWFETQRFVNTPGDAMEFVDMFRYDDAWEMDNEDAIEVEDTEDVQWAGPNYKGDMLTVYTLNIGCENMSLDVLVGLNIFEGYVLISIDNTKEYYLFRDGSTLEEDDLQKWDTAKQEILSVIGQLSAEEPEVPAV